jgi:hypothetical protein
MIFFLFSNYSINNYFIAIIFFRILIVIQLHKKNYFAYFFILFYNINILPYFNSEQALNCLN